jgi:DNA-directed RNA polymerase subunit RPC12/RpoP
MIPKEHPGSLKNQRYAECLNAVVAYVESLPDDSPMLQAIDKCGFLGDWGDGVSVPKDEWDFLIHCDTSDPAAWFSDWASGLVEQYKDGDWGRGAICDRCGRSFDPEWTTDDLPGLTAGQVDQEVFLATLEQLSENRETACPRCFAEAYRDVVRDYRDVKPLEE